MVLAAVVMLAAALALLGGARAAGVRWFDITTASMGQAAPVGTLVVTSPASVGGVHVGDVISFTPPHQDRVFTHRVVELVSDGYRTKGDINASLDPWTVSHDHVIGTVTGYLYGGGFLLRGLPILAVGWLLVYLLTRRGDPSWAWPARIVGASLVFSVASWVVRPWLNADMLGFAPSGGGVDASVVSTGILPIRAVAEGGTFADLVAGQVGTVHTAVTDEHGFFRIVPEPHLSFWWWVAVVAFCVLPLVVSVGIGLPPQRRDGAAVTSTAAVHGVAVLAVLAVLVSGGSAAQPSQAGFTAKVTNTTDRAGTRTWFTCRTAETTTASPWQVYALTDAATGTAVDLSGHGFNATYSGAVAGSTAAIGCVRDTPVASASFTNGCLYSPTAASQTNPSTFSIEMWVKHTDSVTKLAGFASVRTASSETVFDRNLYLTSTGTVAFGVLSSGVRRTVTSAAAVNDGTWHHLVATLSSTAMSLYVDGVLAGSLAGPFVTSSYTGWWRFGCGNIAGWPGIPAGSPLNTRYVGQMSYAAIYTTALTATQVAEHYAAGRP